MYIRLQVVGTNGTVLYEQHCPANGFTQWDAQLGLPIRCDGQTIGRISLDVRPGPTETPPMSLADAARQLAIRAANQTDVDDNDDSWVDSDLEELPEPIIAPTVRLPAVEVERLYGVRIDQAILDRCRPPGANPGNPADGAAADTHRPRPPF